MGEGREGLMGERGRGKVHLLMFSPVSPHLSSVHAAIMAINEALDREDKDEIVVALGNPNACLVDLDPQNNDRYVPCLIAAKREKTSQCMEQVWMFVCAWFVCCLRLYFLFPPFSLSPFPPLSLSQERRGRCLGA